MVVRCSGEGQVKVRGRFSELDIGGCETCRISSHKSYCQ